MSAGICLTLGGFIVSELILHFVVLRKLFAADWRRILAVSAIVIVVQLRLTPFADEAFSWADTVPVSTLSYAGAILLSAVLFLLHDQEIHGVFRWLLTAAALLMTVLTSLGAYATAVFLVFFYLAVCLWDWCRKAPSRMAISVGMILYDLSFLLRLVSPSARESLESLGEARVSLVKMVWRSLKTAFPYAVGSVLLVCIIGAVLLLPLFIEVVKEKEYRFPLPALVTAVSFGCYVTLYFPSLYTSGLVGGNQAMNIYRWAFYLWLYGNELYWIGWYGRRRREALTVETE